MNKNLTDFSDLKDRNLGRPENQLQRRTAEAKRTISLDTKLALLILDTNDVGSGLESEDLTSLDELDVNVGELVQVGAVLSNVTDGLEEGVNLDRGTDDERGSSIDDGGAEEAEDTTASSRVVSVDLNGGETKLPVGLRHDGDLVEGASVVRRVDLSKVDGRASSSGSRVEVDGEQVVLDQTLLPHQIEGRSDVVSGDTGVGKTCIE